MSAKEMFNPADHEFSRAEERLYAREELVYNVTEDILVSLEELNVSKQELAKRLGKSRSFVTQILSGSRNMTLGSLSDICFALGVKPKVVISMETRLSSLKDNREIQWNTLNEPKQEVMQKATVRDTKNVIPIGRFEKLYEAA